VYPRNVFFFNTTFVIRNERNGYKCLLHPNSQAKYVMAKTEMKFIRLPIFSPLTLSSPIIIHRCNYDYKYL